MLQLPHQLGEAHKLGSFHAVAPRGIAANAAVVMARGSRTNQNKRAFVWIDEGQAVADGRRRVLVNVPSVISTREVLSLGK